MRLGRIAEAEADLRELIAWVGELGVPYGDYRIALPWVISPLVDALLERGEVDEAQNWVTLTGLETGWPEIFGFTFLLDSLARLRLAQRRAPEALNLARECERRQRAWGFRNPGFVAWGSTLAAAAHATGRTEEALDAVDEQADWAERFGVAREHGLALLARGAHHRRRGDASGAPPRCWKAHRRGSTTRTRWPSSATASRCAPRSSWPSAAARPRSPPAPATRSSRPAPSRAARR